MNISELSKKEFNTLKNTILFQNLSENLFENIIRDDRCYLKTFKKDTNIYSDNKYLKCLAYIKDGSALIKSKSSVYLMRKINKGSFFSVANIFLDSEYISEIVVKKEMSIIFFDEYLVKETIRNSSDFALNYIKFLADRIYFLNQKIDLLTNNTNTNKVIAYLLNEYDRQGKNIRLDGSYAKLAEILNMSRASLYRALDEMQDKKMINRKGKDIEIINLDAFENQI